MEKNKSLGKLRLVGLPFLFLVAILFLSQCKDDKEEVVSIHDPSLPVKITSFTPERGGVSTQMLIYGSNFGTDTSLIKVFINNKKAPLIGSTGSELYVMVPSRADTGYISVKVGRGTLIKEASSNQKFNYLYQPSVSTLCGFTDKDGKTSIVDGPIDKAQFEEPYWLAFDKDKNIYLLEESRALRMINKNKTTVTTKFRTGRGLDRPRTISFNPTYDLMYVTNDQGNWTGIATVTLTPESNFTDWTAIIFSKQCNGGATHPETGDYFYNSFEQGYVYKWHPETQTSEQLFRIDDVNWEFNIQFAPSGDFAYIVVVNRHYILKSTYNRETGKLEAPTHLVGTRGTNGYVDGVGTNTRFSEPHQGAFDEHDNFYVCDRMNHCIRKITPEGIVSTFAGRGTNYGYTDGTLSDAQFDRPHGIIYDQEDGAFYIADQKNRCIRVIRTE